MQTVGSFEAKTRFPTLLERVIQGEKITITRNGVPVAMLVPVNDASWQAPDTRGEVRDYRVGQRIEGPTVREMLQRERRAS